MSVEASGKPTSRQMHHMQLRRRPVTEDTKEGVRQSVAHAFQSSDDTEAI